MNIKELLKAIDDLTDNKVLNVWIGRDLDLTDKIVEDKYISLAFEMDNTYGDNIIDTVLEYLDLLVIFLYGIWPSNNFPYNIKIHFILPIDLMYINIIDTFT